jgi:hypothetical protein
MELKSVKIDKRFVPQFNGNRDLPSDEQVVIYFSRIPGTSEKMNYKSFKFNQKSDMELVYNDQMLISAFVDRIDNLALNIDGERKRIRKGSELAQANNSALADLFTEIRDYLFPDNEDFSEGESEA